MSAIKKEVTGRLEAAKAAAPLLSSSPGAQRSEAIKAIADALEARTEEVLAANAIDLEAGAAAGLDAALMDRLELDRDRVRGIAEAARAVAAIEDPIDEEIEGHRLENGLELRKVRRPLGVVCIVYEGRPNVTIDAAAICLKSGNVAVLRGSSAAARSNAVLAGIAAEAVAATGLPEASVTLIGGGDREELEILGTSDGLLDLIIPRGGEGLKKALESVATVPVIFAAAGNCHVYVDASADIDMASAIVINAKVQRPGVCNAAETLIVHESIAAEFVPRVLRELAAEGVELRCDGRAAALAGSDVKTVAATDADFASEFLAPVISVGVVDSLDQAIAHVNRFGSGHSEAIITGDRNSARAFQSRVDAAAIYVNASTRFTDGGEFGMGAEMGISTQKLHVRGPIGVRELTTFTWLIDGDGQIRG